MKPTGQWKEAIGVGLRGLLGLWVGWLGMLKVLDPVTFLKAVRQYGLTENPWLLNGTAILLPWLEVLCGLLLILGVAVRGTAWLLTVLLIGFTLVVAWHGWQLHTLTQIPLCAVKFDCGCGTGEVRLCAKLVENVLLTAVATCLGTGIAGRAWALRYSLFGSERNS